jgi:hypothetical protein
MTASVEALANQVGQESIFCRASCWQLFSLKVVLVESEHALNRWNVNPGLDVF